MTVNDMYLDQIQDEQDRHILQRQQFVEYNTPREPHELKDINGDAITEDEVWMTYDGLVPLSGLVAYCKDAIDERVCDIETAIEVIEDNGGYEYDFNR